MSVNNDGLMWALVKEKPEEGLWMKRVPIPEVGPNDVKIKIHKTAICGTDVHIWQWNDWAQHTIPIGLTAGHEYVGEVVEVGAGVKGFNIGDLVSGEGHITCGKCRNCLEGHKENCKDAKGVGVNRNGAFAEYLVIPASNVWPCNPNIPEEMYAIFDPFGNATHTALSYDVLGEDVLIAGAGPIGMMAAAICRHVGARHVVVTDMIEYRLDLAKKKGLADVTLIPGEGDLPEKVRDLTKGRGADVVLEVAGGEDTFQTAWQIARPNAVVVVVAMYEEPQTLPLPDMYGKNLTFRTGGVDGRYGQEIMDLTARGKLDVSFLITHRCGLDEIMDAYEIFEHKKEHVIKFAVKP